MPRVKDWRRPELGPEPELRAVRSGRQWPWYAFQAAIVIGIMAGVYFDPETPKAGPVLMFFGAYAVALLATMLVSGLISLGRWLFTRRPDGLTANQGETHGDNVSLPPAAGRGQLSEDNGRLGVRKHLR